MIRLQGRSCGRPLFVTTSVQSTDFSRALLRLNHKARLKAGTPHGRENRSTKPSPAHQLSRY